jgi:hypothetical protein
MNTAALNVKKKKGQLDTNGSPHLFVRVSELSFAEERFDGAL